MLRSHRWRTGENSAAYLLGHLRPGMTVLDVGCGPATITTDLARRVTPGRVLGIDASTEVVAEARRSLDPTVPVDLEVGDVMALAAADGTFDVAHAHQVLQHLADPVAALAEMARVVRPGGIIAVRDSDYGAMTWFPEDPRLEEWRHLYRAVARANGGEPDAGRRLLTWAHAAGLDEVSPTASVWCFATPEERTWWGELWAVRVTESSLADQAVERGLARPRELAAMAEAWRSWAAEPGGWFCAPHAELIVRRP